MYTFSADSLAPFSLFTCRVFLKSHIAIDSSNPLILKNGKIWEKIWDTGLWQRLSFFLNNLFRLG